MNVLVVAPHPDDEVLGCGGVIARHAAQGDRVHVAVVTRGIAELFPPELIEESRQEMRAAHQILGVSGLSFLDFPAPMLDTVPKYKISNALGNEIKLHMPEILYLPHRGDIHSDHQIIFHSALVAARPINDCPVRRILCYETLSETEWAVPSGENAFIPTVYQDISKYLEVKLKALSCFRTQMKPSPHPRSLLSIENLARLRGATVSSLAAEAFILIREIQ
jgi:LmbE family N-acetylglucosaminyl deacetylase